MSTAVYVYSVPVEKLRSVAGSKDKALLVVAGKPKLQGFFQTIDQIAEDFDEEEEKPPKCAVAFERILKGERCDRQFGYVYGYAYEALCKTIGAAAEPSWTQIAGAIDWFEEIDEALALLGIPLKVMNLVYRGPLIEIPKPDDYPGLGWWEANEIAKAAVIFNELDLERLDGKAVGRVESVADEIEDVRSWIRFAACRPGDWLIGVHS